MVNVHITLLLVIFLLVLIVVIVTALTVRKNKKVNTQNYDKHKKDKAWIAGMKAYCKAYYIRNNRRTKTQARIAYKINRKNKLAAANALSKILHALNPESLKAKCRTWYNKNKTSKHIKSRLYSKLKHYILKKQESAQQLIIVRILSLSEKGLESTLLNPTVKILSRKGLKQGSSHKKITSKMLTLKRKWH